MGGLWALFLVVASASTTYFHEAAFASGSCTGDCISTNYVLDKCYVRCDGTFCGSFEFTSDPNVAGPGVANIANETRYEPFLNCSGPLSQSFGNPVRTFTNQSCSGGGGGNTVYILDDNSHFANCSMNADYGLSYLHVMFFTDTLCNHCNASINYLLYECVDLALFNGTSGSVKASAGGDPTMPASLRTYTDNNCSQGGFNSIAYNAGCQVSGSTSSQVLIDNNREASCTYNQNIFPNNSAGLLAPSFAMVLLLTVLITKRL